MHYYRFRSDSELSFKELIYNEIYFSSPEECNDPFDSKTFYEFPHDTERWRRLLDQSLHIQDKDFKDWLLNELVAHILKLPVMTLEKLMNESFLNLPPLNTKMQQKTLIDIEKSIRTMVGNYIPEKRFFACFSKNCTESLMWSHYASSHRGYCLIFQSIEGKLQIGSARKRRSISRLTPKSFAQQMSYTLPESFGFIDIDYKATVEPLNAFKCLTAYIYGESSGENMDTLREEQNSHYQQKAIEWYYEQESRVILTPPPAYLFGEHIDYTNHERLFYYQPTQLVGIVFGAKMPQKQKDRLREIIYEKKQANYLLEKPYINFDFVIHEAHLTSNQRTLTIEPIELLSATTYRPGDEHFERLYQRWKEGEGLYFEGSSARKIKCS